MTTMAKLIKDTNGNIILPKTRANWVYCEDNESVESKIGSISSINTSSIIYKCTHVKEGTIHNLTALNLPIDEEILHISFIATSNYVIEDTFIINTESYNGLLTNMDTLPDNIFKVGSLVTIDIDTVNKLCFFKSGGVSGPPKEPTDEPESYHRLEVFTTDTVWNVPETSWYRIICIGKSGNGGDGGGSYFSNRYGKNGSGGNAGGIACSALLLEKDTQFQITVNTTVTSFGPDLTATYGGNGERGAYYPESGNVGSAGKPSTIFGDGYGGNKANITGMVGNHTNIYGGWYQSDLSYINQYFVPEDRLLMYCGQGKSYFEWTFPHVQVSGAGGGGSGYSSSSASTTTIKGGTGQPGVCIIEKALK